jgi:hypothetical protein
LLCVMIGSLLKVLLVPCTCLKTVFLCAASIVVTLYS